MRVARVAISRLAGSMADDCGRADLVVLSVPAPKGCNGPDGLVDFFDVRAADTHAIHVNGAHQFEIAVVAGACGVRPWAPPLAWMGARRKKRKEDGGERVARRARSEDRSGLRPARVGHNAAPLDMLDALRLPRPEVADDVAFDWARETN